MHTLNVFDPSGATEIICKPIFPISRSSRKPNFPWARPPWTGTKPLTCSYSAASTPAAAAMRLEARAPLPAAVLPQELKAGAFPPSS